ncbi:glycerate kinase type-2 family protein [Candidatus Harpocratesius sp.]
MKKLSPIIWNNVMKIAQKPNIPLKLRKMRENALKALMIGIESVLPHNLMQSAIKIEDSNLLIQDKSFDLQKYSKILIIGGGKATGFMTESLIDLLPKKIEFSGIINIPYGQDFPKHMKSSKNKSEIIVNFAQHPIPDSSGVKGVYKMIKQIEKKTPETLIIALISGGGSALLTAPAGNITLKELQIINQILLESGASINEINCIRKHLSILKGGQLAKKCYPNPLISLIISDVVGDELDVIASGPTVPDSSTYKDAIEIAQQYHFWEKLPNSVRNHLKLGLNKEIDENPKKNSSIFTNTYNFLIGSAINSANAVQDFLIQKNYSVSFFNSALQGEAKEFGKNLVNKNLSSLSKKFPYALIGTGELTVTLKGDGKGGRNQEMLLSFLLNLLRNKTKTSSSIWNTYDFVIVACAFDGLEGNSPATGAIIDSSTLERMKKSYSDLNKYLLQNLEKNNSFEVFKKLGDALIIGQTGTNVNDMILILLNL